MSSEEINLADDSNYATILADLEETVDLWATEGVVHQILSPISNSESMIFLMKQRRHIDKKMGRGGSSNMAGIICPPWSK